MSKTGEIPYTWPQIEDQVKEAIFAQASILASFGPSCDGRLVADYIGISEEEFQGTLLEHITDIDIHRHSLFQHVKIAYNYAYQLEGCQDTPDVYWHDTDGLLQGFPQTNANAEPSPFCRWNDFPLRRVLETFFARYALFEVQDSSSLADPSIRELSLMANMTIPAVRTSLSKEGFKLEKVPANARASQEEAGFRLNAADAKTWLSRRRGFIPQHTETGAGRMQQIIDQVLSDRDIAFPLAVARIMELRKINASHIITQTNVDQTWLSNLIAEQPVAPDLPALRSIARLLDAPEPDFVSMGVRHILAMETMASKT